MVQAPPSRRGGSGRGGGPGRGGPQGQNRQSRDGGGGGGRGGGPREGRPPREARQPREEDTGGYSERVVYTRRIAKVVKGGRRLRFNALVVVGDGQGTVGAGLGKALVIPDAVRKGNAVARRDMVTVPLRGSTIPQQITVKKGATIVLIKPAREGTGVIAAGAMRAILELGGVKDVVGKSLGSRNPINIVYATMEALRQLRDPATELAKRGIIRPAPARANGASETAAEETAQAS